MKRGAQPGNKSAGNQRLFRDALRRQVRKLGGDGPEGYQAGLDKLANVLLECALEKQPWAVIEVRNTLDGKPKEQVEVTTTVNWESAVKQIVTVDTNQVIQEYADDIERSAGSGSEATH